MLRGRRRNFTISTPFFSGWLGAEASAPHALHHHPLARGISFEAVKQQLRPLFDQVVIKELEPDRVRRSGLLLPPGEHESPPQHGIVLAVGPGLDWWGGVGIKMPVAPGDHVVFPASAGVWIDIEEERLLVCRVGQLLGVLEEVDEPSEGSLGGGSSVAGSAE
jgi:chaperonin GroES